MHGYRLSARHWLAVAALMLVTGCAQCADPEGTLKSYLGLDELQDAGPRPAPQAVAAPTGGQPPAAAPSSPTALDEHLAKPLSACAILAGARQHIEPATAVLNGTISGGDKTIGMIGNRGGASQLVHVGDYIGEHCWRITAITSEWALVKRIPNPAKPHVEGSARIYVNGHRN